MLTATVWGGAGEHGRSCYHVASGGASILLDCGVKKTGTGEYPLLDPKRIPELTAVFLSHAHEDHSMGLPLLYQQGYRGEVWTTRATIGQLPVYFRLWREHVLALGVKLPYEDKDVDQIRYRCLEEESAAGEWFQAAPGVEACWGPSGHLPGSVWFMFRISGKRLFYSGDYSSESILLRASMPNLHDAYLDLAIIESAYGARTEVQAEEVDRLIAAVRRTLSRLGHVLMPVPIFGRGQELLTLLSEAIPDASIVCESLLLQGFEDLDEYTDWLWPDALARMRQALNRNVTIARTDANRAAALAGPPSIIFVPDGMLQTSIARAYYYHLSQQPQHALLFTGHLYEGSYGAEVWQRAKRGSERCEVMRFHYKIHQGLPDVVRMLEVIRPRQTLLVHADKENTESLIDRLSTLGFTGMKALSAGERIKV